MKASQPNGKRGEQNQTNQITVLAAVNEPSDYIFCFN